MEFTDVDDAEVEYSKYLYGRGHPQGELLTRLLGAIDGWWPTFDLWLEALAGIELQLPSKTFSAKALGEGIIPWTLDGQETSLPGFDPHFDVMMEEGCLKDQVDHLLLQRALSKAAIKDQLPIEHVLLADARAAFRRADMKSTVIEACSAVEVCLNDRLLARLDRLSRRNREALLKENRTLGRLHELLGKMGESLPPNLKGALITPRNNAVHSGAMPAKDIAREALKVATKVVLATRPIS